MSLQNFSSPRVERHNKPEVEMQQHKELLLKPLRISRSDGECVLIEPAINSLRMSIKIKQKDEVDAILTKKFTRFMMRRAESFFVLRRKAIDGYDISFLITNIHTETLIKRKLIDFIITFMADVDKEISEMKLSINARARICADRYLSAFVIS